MTDKDPHGYRATINDVASGTFHSDQNRHAQGTPLRHEAESHVKDVTEPLSSSQKHVRRQNIVVYIIVVL
jgi:hypothetical protein